MPASVAFEKHYCVSEVAELWGLSERTIRRIFTDEPGVIKWESSETRYKRGYTTLRIRKVSFNACIGSSEKRGDGK